MGRTVVGNRHVVNANEADKGRIPCDQPLGRRRLPLQRRVASVPSRPSSTASATTL